MRVPHELIVIDNGAPPQGFTAPVNAGLRAARGRYLVVLNDDVEVLDGWWEPLARALDVGHKIVFPRTIDAQPRRFPAWCFAMRRDTLKAFGGRHRESSSIRACSSGTRTQISFCACPRRGRHRGVCMSRAFATRRVALSTSSIRTTASGAGSTPRSQATAPRSQVKHPHSPRGPRPTMSPRASTDPNRRRDHDPRRRTGMAWTIVALARRGGPLLPCGGARLGYIARANHCATGLHRRAGRRAVLLQPGPRFCPHALRILLPATRACAGYPRARRATRADLVSDTQHSGSGRLRL